MTDPLLVAARDVVQDALGELRRALEGADTATLNAVPAGPGSNSLAVLGAHALSSTRSWLALATQAPLPPRDRPAEFRTSVQDPAGFLTWVDAEAEACRRLLMDADSFDPAHVGFAPWRGGAEAEEPVTAGWALLHAVAHLREHVGHVQLTRQVLDGS